MRSLWFIQYTIRFSILLHEVKKPIVSAKRERDELEESLKKPVAVCAIHTKSSTYNLKITFLGAQLFTIHRKQ